MKRSTHMPIMNISHKILTPLLLLTIFGCNDNLNKEPTPDKSDSSRNNMSIEEFSTSSKPLVNDLTKETYDHIEVTIQDNITVITKGSVLNIKSSNRPLHVLVKGSLTITNN